MIEVEQTKPVYRRENFHPRSNVDFLTRLRFRPYGKNDTIVARIVVKKKCTELHFHELMTRLKPTGIQIVVRFRGYGLLSSKPQYRVSKARARQGSG